MRVWCPPAVCVPALSSKTSLLRGQIVHLNMCVFEFIEEGEMERQGEGAQWREEQKERD